MSVQEASKAETDGYRAIFKSSSLLGGSQAICYLLSLIRTKALAYYLGPAGVGLLGVYTSIAATVGALSGLGIGDSAVREAAAAYGTGEQERSMRALKLIRRASFLSGLLGFVICVLFARQLSVFCFGTDEHALAIAVLGVTLLAGAVAAGELAFLQGSGRYVTVAKINILATLITVAPVIVIYALWKEAGIIPALLLSSLLSLLVTGSFTRPLGPTASISWKRTLIEAKPMLYLGFSFMLIGLLWSGKDIAIRSILTRSYGLETVGIFQAAWAISGLSVNFILKAMGMDFYPRLTAMADDHVSMNKAVNQQIEIGILLALPGVIAVTTCAPMVLLILYSSKFYAASGLLAVLSTGVFFKIVSYPLNTIQLAKGDARGFAFFAAAFALLEIGLGIPLVLAYGPMGAALAYSIGCAAHIFTMAWVGRKMINYHMDERCLALLLMALIHMAAALSIAFFLPGYMGLSMGGVLVLISSILCFRGVVKRLGREHRFIRLILRLPLGWLIR